ncbi:hypothetical protein FISHEDRAFT_71786 [Fistulina hepatica ATCC 64428]|uniref:Uncharacterized protein n=1 Tax=Fistulina hepatica ATCC 64428 TaxID=1128425 RepID=A0A0D7AFI9_9AGAR|nr:hypothetical protein FISHEDRAFT_71786 [Fistulina hepatica ATCC 64428]
MLTDAYGRPLVFHRRSLRARMCEVILPRPTVLSAIVETSDDLDGCSPSLPVFHDATHAPASIARIFSPVAENWISTPSPTASGSPLAGRAAVCLADYSSGATDSFQATCRPLALGAGAVETGSISSRNSESSLDSLDDSPLSSPVSDTFDLSRVTPTSGFSTPYRSAQIINSVNGCTDDAAVNVITGDQRSTRELADLAVKLRTFTQWDSSHGFSHGHIQENQFALPSHLKFRQCSPTDTVRCSVNDLRLASVVAPAPHSDGSYINPFHRFFHASCAPVQWSDVVDINMYLV